MQVVESIEYSVEQDGRSFELVVTVEGLNFVEETIPDGQMAGMMGHREVPCENVMRFPIHPAQVRRLIGELERVAVRDGNATRTDTQTG